MKVHGARGYTGARELDQGANLMAENEKNATFLTGALSGALIAIYVIGLALRFGAFR